MTTSHTTRFFRETFSLPVREGGLNPPLPEDCEYESQAVCVPISENDDIEVATIKLKKMDEAKKLRC